jgi:hypothetical protein
MTRWLAAVLWPLAVLVILAAPAKADLGGSVPGPGGCDYPMIGGSGASFGEYDYACAGPTEINGSHWESLYGGGMWQANAGVSILFINASVTTPVGVLRGITYWACPDLSMSDPPNPPGAWKSYIVPAKCKTVGAKPELLPDGQPAPPPGAPDPPVAPPVPGTPGYVVPGNNLDPTLPNPEGSPHR